MSLTINQRQVMNISLTMHCRQFTKGESKYTPSLVLPRYLINAPGCGKQPIRVVSALGKRAFDTSSLLSKGI
jgi:hypothetical protein